MCVTFCRREPLVHWSNKIIIIIIINIRKTTKWTVSFTAVPTISWLFSIFSFLLLLFIVSDVCFCLLWSSPTLWLSFSKISQQRSRSSISAIIYLSINQPSLTLFKTLLSISSHNNNKNIHKKTTTLVQLQCYYSSLLLLTLLLVPSFLLSLHQKNHFFQVPLPFFNNGW